ncbi:MAG: molybdenum cofactor guanylyltransferase [Phycisphaeraceae bacterium]|nr:molybdenum cofactor guanylyltransferase [Phycisphaeraceae bacterium]
MNRIPAYILAGGRSSRFGSDKARAMIDGRSLLQHAADLLQPVASDITVVADRSGKYDDLGFRTIADATPGLGPLAGLQAALSDLHHDHRWLLLCPCDALVIRPAWLDQLLAACDDQCDAVAFRAVHWQPMPALYAQSCLPLIARQIHTNQRSMQCLLDQLQVNPLPLPDDWPEHWQVNTPSDFAWHQSGQRLV